jgi:hypothetical protein
VLQPRFASADSLCYELEESDERQLEGELKHDDPRGLQHVFLTGFG